MPKVTLYIARNLFDLWVDPTDDPLSTYFTLDDAAKVKIHEDTLGEEVEEALTEYGIKASVSVSLVVPTHGVEITFEDFKVEAHKIRDLMFDVREAVYLNAGLNLKIEEIRLTLHGSVTM